VTTGTGRCAGWLTVAGALTSRSAGALALTGGIEVATTVSTFCDPAGASGCSVGMGGGAVNQAGGGAAMVGCAVSTGRVVNNGSLWMTAVRFWAASSAHPLNVAATAAVMGGRIAVESTVGIGTTVVISLPRAPDRKPAESPEHIPG